jgi:osmoprotectant transport system ATP-binding protein
MDEPFAAIDNITRTRLQDELLRIQQTVRKTILFVTHDVEEALKLADEIVIMRDGQVVQYDTPLNILSKPADEFVAQLTGADDVLRRISLQTAASVMLPWKGQQVSVNAPTVAPGTDLREVLGLLIGSNFEELVVVNEDKQPIGLLTLNSIRQFASAPSVV